MADQPASLSQLLQWSITHTAPSDGAAEPSSQPTDPSRGLDPEMLAQLLGGPSDADRMRDAMAAITAPPAQIDMHNRMIAWDNFEQLIENLDNANNIEPLHLWTPLIQQLGAEEAESRMMAAWCCSTAVQNNVKSQERLLAMGGVPLLAALAVSGEEGREVRRKAVNALSSAVRNYQPALEELEKCLPAAVWKSKGLDAGEMEQVDEVIGKLREGIPRV
ncbi:hypothetical protein LTR08_001074 [Meristemomyces frigidus]|nr:hypothetical protein LTR08_001074 [Meristemomyces frigidus]